MGLPKFRVLAFPKRVGKGIPSNDKSKLGIQIIEDFNFYDAINRARNLVNVEPRNEFDVFNSSQMIRLVVPRIFFRFVGRFIGRIVVAIFSFSHIVVVFPPSSCTGVPSFAVAGLGHLASISGVRSIPPIALFQSA